MSATRPPPATPDPSEETRHASAVALEGHGILIVGPSASGKSGLALDLIARGATLIADDRTRITAHAGWPWLHAPARLAGVIEARSVGLIQVPHVAGAPLRLIVDMGTRETDRLPERRTETLLGEAIACIRRVDAPHFSSAIVALVKGGWWQDD